MSFLQDELYGNGSIALGDEDRLIIRRHGTGSDKVLENAGREAVLQNQCRDMLAASLRVASDTNTMAQATAEELKAQTGDCRECITSLRLNRSDSPHTPRRLGNRG